MNNPISFKKLFLAFPLTMAITLTGCGSSTGTSTANNSLASVGTITGFGSVFVNGVEFETNNATFDLEGTPGTQADLAIGMKVKVMGSINPDGVTGDASSIEFNDELQGPVEGITPSADGLTKSFTVLGTTVIVDSNDTNFDDDSGTFNFSSIENGDNVEISGFFDANDVLTATRIELKDATFNANSIVEVKGTISNLVNLEFDLGSLHVDASSASLKDLPDGLADGQKVEVKGTYDQVNSILNATKVEAHDNKLPDSDHEIELEGIITRYVDDSDFDIDEHPVDASNAERKPLSLTLSEGLRVEAEGTVTNGVLVASEIKTRESKNTVIAPVKTVDATNRSFTVEPVTGMTVTVKITTSSELEDETSMSGSQGLTMKNIFDNLKPGNFVQAKGHLNDTGAIEAKNVHRKEAASATVRIEGKVGASDPTGSPATVTVLGVAFPYDINTTQFKKDGTSSYDATAFFAEPTVINNTAFISIEDTDNNGIADVIKLKSK